MRLRWVVPFVAITTASMSHGPARMPGHSVVVTTDWWVHYCEQCGKVVGWSGSRTPDPVRCEVYGHGYAVASIARQCATCSMLLVYLDRPDDADFTTECRGGRHGDRPDAQSSPDEVEFIPGIGLD